MASGLQLLFTGLAIGGVYALVALGIALTYRATRVVNFAQGDFSTLGAYALVFFGQALGLPYLLAFGVSIGALAVPGLFFAFLIYHPLRGRTLRAMIIATIGASIVFQDGALLLFGPSPQSVPPIVDASLGGGLRLGGLFLDYQYLLLLVVTLSLVLVQYLFLDHTLIGKQMQATSQDREMARMVGIPVTRMIALTFVYSAVLGGLSGMLVAPIFFVTHKMGAGLGFKAFAATIAGGFGDGRGAICAGLALGVIESFGAAWLSVVYKDALAFLLLAVFLLVRPQGIFGESVAEKA